MSVPLWVYLETVQARRGGLLAWMVKVLILLLSVLGLSSLYRRAMDLGGTDLPLATEDRRDRLYEKRLNRTHAVCQQYEEEITLHTVKMFDLVPPAPIGMNADILVDRQREYYWCKVPKAASTSWMSLILSDREYSKLKTSIGQQHMYLRKLMPPPKTIEDLIMIQQKFFSFLTVRHPFERLLSAYRDKFFALSDSPSEKNKRNKFHNMYGRKIIAKYRLKNDTVAKEQKYKEAPTFPEFVDFVVDTEVESLNEHWVPYYLLCTPCNLNYTIIAKTESIEDDSRYILEVLKQHGVGQSQAQRETLTKIHQTGKRSTSLTSREYFSQLNKEQVKALYDKYEIDMEMFDYVIEPYLTFAVNTLPPKYAPKQGQAEAPAA